MSANCKISHLHSLSRKQQIEELISLQLQRAEEKREEAEARARELEKQVSNVKSNYALIYHASPVIADFLLFQFLEYKIS